MSKPTLDDLDRCEHGRHSIDDCLSCPGGWSTGNTFLENGQRIGTTLYGEPIIAVTFRELRDGSPHPSTACAGCGQEGCVVDRAGKEHPL